MNPIDLVEKPFLRADLPEFRPGDTVKVHVRVVEAGRERIQVFQGVAIRRQGGGLRETFTVRKVSFGVGVERTFPVHSPTIAKIEVVSRGHVRRAKLYYLRERRGKKARIRERRGVEIDVVAGPPGEAASPSAALEYEETSEEAPAAVGGEGDAESGSAASPGDDLEPPQADEPAEERA